MIPLRDTVRSRSFPILNLSIIALNTLVFLFEFSLSPRALERFIAVFGLVPARLHLANPWLLLDNPLPLMTLFTHMFLHGGWLHLISNMWILYIFGDNIEDRMGSFRYLLFYLLGGLVSGFLQALISPASRVPAIGASGAIAAVLGAYFVLYPNGRVITLVPMFFFPWFVEIPSVVYLGFWFISQLFSGVASLGLPASSVGGVAWWAHIGGFVYGVFFHRFFVRRVRLSYYDRYPRYPDDFL